MASCASSESTLCGGDGGGDAHSSLKLLPFQISVAVAFENKVSAMRPERAIVRKVEPSRTSLLLRTEHQYAAQDVPRRTLPRRRSIHLRAFRRSNRKMTATSYLRAWVVEAPRMKFPWLVHGLRSVASLDASVAPAPAVSPACSRAQQPHAAGALPHSLATRFLHLSPSSHPARTSAHTTFGPLRLDVPLFAAAPTRVRD
mmetsp:Transcript_26872/g.44614  ORF Transcript_26872/g.44614 Transcript_26872/m.44614 type:complete len:200 (+) Transcript_26872:95-694(+)